VKPCVESHVRVKKYLGMFNIGLNEYLSKTYLMHLH